MIKKMIQLSLLLLLLIMSMLFTSSCSATITSENSPQSYTSEMAENEIVSSIPEKIESNTSGLKYIETKTADVTGKKLIYILIAREINIYMETMMVKSKVSIRALI